MTSVVMKIVPSPRSSYVRIKPLGAPPDSYFDFSALSCHTPTNGSLLTGVVARGAVAVGFGAGLGAGGFGLVCANPTVLHSAVIAMSHMNVRRGSRILKSPTTQDPLLRLSIGSNVARPKAWPRRYSPEGRAESGGEGGNRPPSPRLRRDLTMSATPSRRSSRCTLPRAKEDGGEGGNRT